ncbi:MAG: pyridine nucleotide-disulfide oxidoreductase [Sediminimonas qiaohouensis]|uniref:Pyridine nucleotide-disulfide oxidoreductase n=1 Tax=Sediminimonas qiaohouensis TaxID=552061 RepID=A0A7C9LBA7_9RHOB|nr:FAD-dependent oxidoreductase [Sediminimonas qiaohouensis]MTJ04998.1 pyridine nucleotide-disulfide oxidoreductase [Sediminimonas qiaohouensis]
MDDVVVIGAGQAGASLVARLRSQRFEGGITLLGAEPVAPYQRPPLSKAYLLGDMDVSRLLLRPESYYAENAITLRTDTTAAAIDPDAQRVTLADGETVPFGNLVLATGAVPRRLPASVGGDLEGVHVVRTLADVDALEPACQPGARLLIIGGGYIGLEAAAVAAKLGLHVTLIEAAERILGRVAAPETADFFRDLHRAHGVNIREGVALDHLTAEEGHVTGAQLADGSTLSADLVIVGIGITPDTALAEAAGLAIDNGIAVDEQGRTSAPAIWAAGDCAAFLHDGGRLRLESVPNAIDMAECVADNIMGAETPYVPKPWFWSDQYDVKLQIAGLNTGYTDVVTRPGTREGSVSFWYYAGDRLLAVDAANEPRAYMIGKRLIEAGQSPAPGQVSNPDTDLKALLKS